MSIALLQTSLAVGLLVALVLLLRRPVARRFGARTAYALWLLPMARLVLPPLPESWAPLSRLPMSSSSSAPPAGARDTTTLLADANIAPSTLTDASPVMMSPSPHNLEPEAGLGTGGPLADGLSHLPLVACVIILAGAIAILAMQLWRQAGFSRLVSMDAQPASPQLAQLALMARAEVGLKRQVPVMTSFLCSGPLVTGLLRPVILVPAWFELDYDREEQRLALIHEMMHVRRGDLFALQAAHLLLAVQWFNPLAHRAIRAFRADQEAACDADILSRCDTSPRAYGATLVKAIRLSRPHRTPAIAAGLPLNHSLKDRILLMQNNSPSPFQRRSRRFAAGAAGLTLILATASGVSAGADEPLAGGPGDRATEQDCPDKMKDREFVLLGDPMAGLEDELSALKELKLDFDIVPPPVPPMPPELAELKALSVPKIERLETEDGTFLRMDSYKLRIPHDLEEMPQADRERFESEAERFAKQAERFAERHSARIEAAARRYEAQAEAMAARFEAQIADRRNLAEKAEAMAARMRDSGLQDKVEARARRIEALAQACESEDFAEDHVTIVGEAGDVRAICIKRSGKGPSGREIEMIIEAHPDLTAEERAVLLNHGSRRVHN